MSEPVSLVQAEMELFYKLNLSQPRIAAQTAASVSSSSQLLAYVDGFLSLSDFTCLRKYWELRLDLNDYSREMRANLRLLAAHGIIQLARRCNLSYAVFCEDYRPYPSLYLRNLHLALIRRYRIGGPLVNQFSDASIEMIFQRIQQYGGCCAACFKPFNLELLEHPVSGAERSQAISAASATQSQHSLCLIRPNQRCLIQNPCNGDEMWRRFK